MYRRENLGSVCSSGRIWVLRDAGGSDWVLCVADERSRRLITTSSGGGLPEEVCGTTTHSLPLSLALYEQLAIILGYAYQERTHKGAAIPPAATSEAPVAIWAAATAAVTARVEICEVTTGNVDCACHFEELGNNELAVIQCLDDHQVGMRSMC